MPSPRTLALLGALALSTAFPQGLPPRARPDDYQARLRLPAITIAADYLARTVPLPDSPSTISNYLVLEVAVFPASSTRLTVASNHFSLRINARKTPVLPQAPGLVAAQIKYPDWEPGPQVTVGGSLGDAGVILGPAPPVERFPGDPRGRRQRLPEPVPPHRDPGPGQPQPTPPDEFVQLAALPEGEIPLPAAGLLYFAFKGKTKSIRSLELLYSGPAGSGSLRLF